MHPKSTGFFAHYKHIIETALSTVCSFCSNEFTAEIEEFHFMDDKCEKD